MGIPKLGFLVLILCYSAILVVSTNLFECDVDDFYAGFSADGTEVGESLKSILHDLIDDHERISFGEVVGAMIDLDGTPGADIEDEAVIGIYSQISEEGFDDVWNREHSWPSNRGVGDSGRAHDDLFGLFPANGRLNSGRSNKFFDECVEGVNGCVFPASVGSGDNIKEAADGSSEDRDTWQPPTVVQGDLARAIFYLATRYDGSDANTNALKLASCNSDETCPENTFGNLTTLLRWHVEDPVSPEELARVNGICSDYQGTRNPYVDFPDLALRVFDESFESEDNLAFLLPLGVGGSAVLIAGVLILFVRFRQKRRLEKGALDTTPDMYKSNL